MGRVRTWTALDDARGRGGVAGRSPTGAGRRGGARLWRQLGSFAVVGTLGTATYLLLYLGLRRLTVALVANALAQLVAGVANTAANRRFTFGVTGRQGVLRHQLGGGVALLVGLALSSGVLAALGAVDPRATRSQELAALLGANAVGTVVRFLVLRRVVRAPGGLT
ncbi:GtrA family protein [Kitasatospora sp. NBC_01287]|uniref:GtrA family protein n=1 Tax=Kitasatospora sp. NBC_01287 TaxID=2903573 RepID=UPI00225BD205|nr:GtrA family protein [Kitasatospora sp. NBC_01287]MCX4747724.1 GtrA family protein [Kitasatospora sp. NBC_01287]